MKDKTKMKTKQNHKDRRKFREKTRAIGEERVREKYGMGDNGRTREDKDVKGQWSSRNQFPSEVAGSGQ